ncbi:MAG: hypothetical protein PVF86_03000 [Desulfobacterales bacterium]
MTIMGFGHFRRIHNSHSKLSSLTGNLFQVGRIPLTLAFVKNGGADEKGLYQITHLKPPAARFARLEAFSCPQICKGLNIGAPERLLGS